MQTSPSKRPGQFDCVIFNVQENSNSGTAIWRQYTVETREITHPHVVRKNWIMSDDPLAFVKHEIAKFSKAHSHHVRIKYYNDPNTSR
jgi:hypothetical protein